MGGDHGHWVFQWRGWRFGWTDRRWRPKRRSRNAWWEMYELHMTHLPAWNRKQCGMGCGSHCKNPLSGSSLVVASITEEQNLPRELSHVSYSALLAIVSCTSKTTTLRRRATASQPRLQAIPRTRSLNSSSATSTPAASSHRTTLFGGYSGLRPPPRRKSRDDVWQGTTVANVPPVNSTDDGERLKTSQRERHASSAQ